MLSLVNTHQPSAITDKFAQFESIGCDELILTPVVDTVDQVERLAELLP